MRLPSSFLFFSQKESNLKKHNLIFSVLLARPPMIVVAVDAIAMHCAERERARAHRAHKQYYYFFLSFIHFHFVEFVKSIQEL